METLKICNSVGNEVKIFTVNIEHEAIRQIENLSEYDAYKHSKIRIMPDVHAGKGCTIGTTMTLNGKVTPNLVGVDISCGMLSIELQNDSIDFAKLDEMIRRCIPNGFNIHETIQRLPQYSLKQLRCYDAIDHQRALLSIGTLGGGNHFIEIDKSKNTGRYWLVIHTGSRKLGVDVCHYYQNKAVERMGDKSKEINDTIARLKAESRQSEIEEAVKAIHKSNTFDKDLAHLEGRDFEDYIHDMKILQSYAATNRATIAGIITSTMGLEPMEVFETLHNYIDIENMILRKGSVSARAGEKLLIPINMRDGSLICVGKGNEDWNYSAPHGAGRIMSRSEAKRVLSMDEYKASMEGIYTTSVDSTTIDEAPMAYKSMEEIIEAIQPTCEVVDIIRPVYNFKASE